MQRITDILQAIADKLDTISEKLDGKTAPTSSQTFGDFARYYFDTYRKRKVAPYTFRKDIERYNAHICPAIGKTQLHELLPDRV